MAMRINSNLSGLSRHITSQYSQNASRLIRPADTPVSTGSSVRISISDQARALQKAGKIMPDLTGLNKNLPARTGFDEGTNPAGAGYLPLERIEFDGSIEPKPAIDVMDGQLSKDDWKKVKMLNTELSAFDIRQLNGIIASLSTGTCTTGCDRSPLVDDVIRDVFDIDPDRRGDVLDRAAALVGLEAVDFIDVSAKADRVGELDTFLNLTDSLPYEMRFNFVAEFIEVPDNQFKEILVKTQDLAGDLSTQTLNDLLMVSITAAENGSLDQLLSQSREIMDESGDAALDQFLEAASKIGEFYIGDFLDVYADLDDTEKENMLQAVMNPQGSNTSRSYVIQAATMLSGANRSLFLTAAAGAGEETSHLSRVVTIASLDSQMMHDFLTAANAAGDSLGNLIDKVDPFSDGELEGQQLRDFLSAMAKVGSPETMDRIMTYTDSLAGDDRAHFLDALAQLDAGHETLLDALDQLEGQDLIDFLEAAAQAGTESELQQLIDDVLAG